VIELRGIGRDYVVGGRLLRALAEVDLVLPDGDYVSIMGPSGSGKSTLLNLLGCLDRPTRGEYRIDGTDVLGLPDSELARIRGHRIGFVFQSFHLVPRLSALGNVELPMIFAGIPRPERLRRAAEALDSVGLSPRADHRPEQLSGGERQRVAIARAIVMRPAVLLADEPTGNLDSASGHEIVERLEALQAAGLTLVVVTHDPAIGCRALRQVRLADGAVTAILRRDEAP
jgi:putative ABC transport system ATP-binding protein